MLNLQMNKEEPIAIIGIGCRFPGGANSPSEFWKLLMDGRDGTSEVPATRWDVHHFYDPDREKPAKIYTKRGGYLTQPLDLFDAGFFGISPREASRMDPQQRLLLETTWEALEDAGLPADVIAGKRVAVYVGLFTHDYEMTQFGDPEQMDGTTATGASSTLAANRLSYVFDLHGPSVTLDTACSSSSVAIHMACQSLRHEGCPLAIAGGVNVILRPEMNIATSKASMLSPDGWSKSFDASANGYTRGEGAGIVILKPLAQAQADGDEIYGVILGSAVNQDGHTTGVTVPNGQAQEEAVRTAWQMAGIQATDIQYMEAHATGTAVGDPIEARALGQVLREGRASDETCLVGSVKSNIGHLESAAGVAGLIKVLLAFQEETIPPNLHFATPNPKIDFEALQLQVVDKPTPWPVLTDKPRVAGVNSFGFGGTNAHLVVAGPEYVRRANRPAPEKPALEHSKHLLLLSARSRDALQAVVQAYVHLLGQASADDLTDICYSAALHRSHHEHCLGVVGDSPSALIEQLQAYLANETRPTLVSGRAARHQQPLVFVYSGNGPQWWAMGRQLLQDEPVFRAAVEECDALMRPLAPWSLLKELLASETESRIGETQIAQPLLFALQVGLTALWKSWGVVPDMIVGHSLGEVAAAYAAGVLTLPEAVQVIYQRSRLQQLTAGHGRLLAVGLSVADVQPWLSATVELAAVNSPSSVTIVGDVDALKEIEAALTDQQIFCRFVPGNIPFHGRHMEPLMGELAATLGNLRPQAAQIPLVSTVTGKPVLGLELGADYWPQNIRQPVQFAPAIDYLIQSGRTLFVEIGPHPVLSHSINECLGAANTKGVAAGSLRRQDPESSAMRASLGRLYTMGARVAWEQFYSQGKYVKLPHYPWQRESYWNESEDARLARLGGAARRGSLRGQSIHPLLGGPLALGQPGWDNALDCDDLPYLSDHQVQGAVVYPAAAYVEMSLSVARELLGPELPYVIEKLEFQKALFLPEHDPAHVQLLVDPNRVSFEILSRPKGPDASWTHHSQGKLIHNVKGRKPKKLSLAELQQRCNSPRSVSEIYRAFKEIGLEYGPQFQGLSALWSGDQEALGQFHVDLPPAESGEYLWYPVLLDVSFQTLLAAIGADEAPPESSYLPAQLERVTMFAPGVADGWSYVQLREIHASYLRGDIYIFNAAGQILLEMTGLVCRALPQGAADNNFPGHLLYDIRWELLPGPAQAPVARVADHLPSPAAIQAVVAPALVELYDALERDRTYTGFAPKGEQLGMAYIMRAFQQMGWAPHSGELFTTAELCQVLSIQPRHHPLMRRILGFLAADGLLREVSDAWQVTDRPWSDLYPAPEDLWLQLMDEYPEFLAELLMLGRCGKNLAAALQGQIDPLELLFPNGTSWTNAHLYQDAPTSRFYNLTIQKVLQAIVDGLPEQRTLRILEIGAGTGGTAAHILPYLPASRTEYVFTDSGKVLLDQAEDKFRNVEFVQYRVLDIEQDIQSQGFELHSFDIVIASDVLHATQNITRTLTHVKQLLASDGLLVIMELANPWRTVDLTVGLLPGWWAFKDFELRPRHCCLSIATWQQALTLNAFGDVAVLTDQQPEKAFQAVYVARGPHLAETITAPAETVAPAPVHGRWLAFADDQGIVSQLESQLQVGGGVVYQVLPGETYQVGTDIAYIRPTEPGDVRQLLADLGGEAANWLGVLHAWNMNRPASDLATMESLVQTTRLGAQHTLYVIQALGASEWKTLPRLWILTNGAQPIHGQSTTPAQASVWGVVRTALLELPNLPISLIDLSASPTNEEISNAIHELQLAAPEDEVGLRGHERYVRRLIPTYSADLRSIDHALQKSPYESNEAFLQWRLTDFSALESLSLRTASRRPVEAHEVEIEIQATGINFRDVVSSIFSLESTYSNNIGMECSGRVVAVGSNVTRFKVGDAVVGLAPECFGQYTIAPETLVTHLPNNLSFEAAATIPGVFLTAYYCLHHLARIKPGDEVLIHAASGGVGLAAIQIAKAAGANVLVTAGSSEKRFFLKQLGVTRVMDSRSLNFADEVLAYTNGRGVDVVLNSLAGEALRKSLAIMAPFGRFVEIGKRDVEQNSTLEMQVFRSGLSFHFFDLERSLIHDMDTFGRLLREIIQKMASGEFHPLPYRVFPAEQLPAALQHLAKARHIGKVVVSLRDFEQYRQRMTPTPSFRPDGSYLITGGLGGFGLALANWLVEHGARHLVLLGRSGAATRAAQDAVAQLQAAGAEVIIAQADAAQPGQLARVLEDIRRSPHPLRGVIHGAMVLADTNLLQMTQADFDRAFTPKAYAAWNLHLQTRPDPLDFFVLCSSVVSTMGNPGQANYAAGNAFLDSLAYHRRAQGLPALTVNWGALAEVGYVAQNTVVLERLQHMGIHLVSLPQALKVLGELLCQGAGLAAAVSLDWQRWLAAYSSNRLPGFAQRLVSAESSLTAATADVADHHKMILQLADPQERYQQLSQVLAEQVGHVIGLSTARLDLETSLTSLGLDSLMAVELSNRLKRHLGVNFSTMQLLQGIGVNQLADAILEQLGLEKGSPAATSGPEMVEITL